MDFKSLYYPLAVAKYKSISQAAKELNIKQPSLSKCIQTINDSLGVELFEMKGQELVITYAGERYLYWANRMIPLIAELDKVHQTQKKASLKIITPAGESAYVSPLVLQQFRKEYADVFIEMQETQDIKAALLSGEANLAVLTEIFVDAQYQSELLVNDEIIMVTSRNHLIKDYAVWKEGCRYPWVDGELLKNETQVIYDQDPQVLQLLQDYFVGHDIVMQSFMSTGSINQAVRTAAITDAVCFIPERLLRHCTFSEKVLKYSIGAPLTVKRYLAYQKNSIYSEYINRLAALIKDFPE